MLVQAGSRTLGVHGFGETLDFDSVDRRLALCKRVSQPHHAEDYTVDTVAMMVPVVMSPRGLVFVGV